MKKYRSLPTEILEKIFHHLSGADLESSMFVCRSWNIAATKFFWDRNAVKSLKTKAVCLQLLVFLVLNPVFASRLKSLDIQVRLKKVPDEEDKISTYDCVKAIISMTANLGTLDYLSMDFDTIEIFELLGCQEIELPYIKKLEFLYEHMNDPITDLHLSDFFKFRKSLTHLKLLGLTDRSFALYGGMYKYISSFPNLEYLGYTTHCGLFSEGLSGLHIFDFPELLEENKQLEELVIVGDYSFITQSKLVNQQQKATTSLCLSRLKLRFVTVDVNTLRYITNKLLNMWSLEISPHKPYDSFHRRLSYGGSALPGENKNPMEALMTFKDYCESMEGEGEYQMILGGLMFET